MSILQNTRSIDDTPQTRSREVFLGKSKHCKTTGASMCLSDNRIMGIKDSGDKVL